MQAKERQDSEKASFPGNKMLLPLVRNLKELLVKQKASSIFTYLFQQLKWTMSIFSGYSFPPLYFAVTCFGSSTLIMEILLCSSEHPISWLQLSTISGKTYDSSSVFSLTSVFISKCCLLLSVFSFLDIFFYCISCLVLTGILGNSLTLPLVPLNWTSEITKDYFNLSSKEIKSTKKLTNPLASFTQMCMTAVSETTLHETRAGGRERKWGPSIS